MTETETVSTSVSTASDSGITEASPVEQLQRKRQMHQRIYLIRIPKPQEVPLDGLEKEKEDIDTQLRHVGMKLTPLMEERSQLTQNIADLRNQAEDEKAQIEDLELFVNPFQAEKRAANENREAQKKLREEQKAKQEAERETRKKEREDRIRAEQNVKQKKKNDFNNAYGHLSVSNDQEIDAKIQELEYRQQHESMDINQEKLLIKQIKQLQDAREPVREHAAWLDQEKADKEFRVAEKKRRLVPAPVEVQEPIANGVSEIAQPSDEELRQQEEAAKQKEAIIKMKQELDSLWNKHKATLDEKNKLHEDDKKLKSSIDTLVGERNALRQKRDEIWDKLQKHRAEMRLASKPFSQNRAFSSKVRDFVKKGEVEEAQKLCKEQVEEVMQQYRADAAYRHGYNQLFDAQTEYKRPLAMYQADSFQSTAQTVIADALENARKKLNLGKQKEKEQARPASQPVETKKDDSEPSTSTTTYVSYKQNSIPGMEPEATSRSKPRKPKKQKSTLVELPVIDQTEFVPPPTALKSDAKVLSDAERREQERERNKIAQAEAVQRKEKRQEAKEKKRQQKAQKAEQQFKKPASEASEEAAGPDTPDAHEGQLPNGELHGADDLNSNELRAPVNGETKLKNRTASRPKNKLEKIVAAPKVRPIPRKKSWNSVFRTYGRTAYNLAAENPAIAAGGAFVFAIVFVISPIVYLTY